MKSQLIVWSPVFPFSITLAVAAVLLLLAIYLEIKKNQRFKGIRLFTITCVFVSILGLLLRPAFTIASKKTEVILLTKNYSKQQADSLTEKNKQLKMVRMADAEGYPSSELYETYSEFESSNDQVKFVIGEGIPANVLYKLKHTTFQYFPAPMPEGIIDLHFPKRIIANRWNVLEGEYINGNSTTFLKLISPGGIEDSVSISTKGRNPFSLSFYPRQAGKFMYELIEKDSITGKECAHSLPLEVVTSASLQILFISGYPTFEQRFLKNYLINHGHQVIVRNHISKDRYHIETANRPSLSFQSITNELLEDMDLVLIDPISYASLSSVEQRVLEKSILNGLGVLVLPESSQDRLLVKPLIQFREEKVNLDTSYIVLNRRNEVQLPVLLGKAEGDVVAVLSDKRRNVVAGFVHKGLGKVAFQLLRETYSLVLQNKSEAYAEIWSELLEQSAREKQEDKGIEIDSAFPYLIGDPLKVTVSSARLPDFRIDSVSYPLTEDVRIDDVWHGEIVPLTKGWHALQLDDMELPVYIVERGEWQSMAIRNQMLAMQKYADLPFNDSVSSLYVHQMDLSIWFLIILLLSVTILWLIPKL